MKKTLHIQVKNKIATYKQRGGAVVCGNTDYQIAFDFDAEWDKYPEKTARFIWNGRHFDQPFTGNVCPMPMVFDTTSCSVGVYVEDLETTTPAKIDCLRSVLCGGTPKHDGNNQVYADEAKEAANQAKSSARQADDSANRAEGHSTAAADSAQTATAKASEAVASASAAVDSAQTASTKASETAASASAAAGSAANAATSAAEATGSAANAATSETNAKAAKEGAETARSGAESAAGQAANLASAAASAAQSAENHSAAAANSATSAGNSAQTASAKASEAAASASASAKSASNATAKADEAKSSATAAANSAASAQSGAQTATDKANDAATSATNASASETNAKNAESGAKSAQASAEAARVASEKARDDAQAIVGGDFASTEYVRGQINSHNTNTAAHNDIRLLIEGLGSRLNTLANSDDTTLDQMAEVVAYIKANRDLISQITTNKVNVGDIVNDLATNVSNKPLSAAQGVALKALIDAITIPVTSVNGKTGAVQLVAGDVGARPNTWTPTAADVGALPTSGGTVSGNIFLGTGAIPSSNFGAVLGTDALRFFQLFCGEYYFANVDPNYNSPYKFGMYQWDDNFTFVTRWAEGNSFYKDAWQINGSTAVTNFTERPTVAGADVALRSEIPSNKETWTFTVKNDDGTETTVTKEVYIG